MSKRKRGEDLEDGEATSNFRQQRRIMATFEDSSKQLAKAFKTARGFERQKLGRRKKNAAASKDTQEMDRIDAEVAALKTLDMTKCAAHHISKSILKIKAVATHPDLPNELKTPIALSKHTAALNVNARLCNSNPVKEVFPVLFGNLKREFGVVDDVEGPSKKKRLRAKDFDTSRKERSASITSVDREAAERKLAKAGVAKQNYSEQDVSTGDDSGSEEFLDALEERLASSSDNNGEVESDDDIDMGSDLGSDIEDLERQLEQEGISRKSQTSKSQSYDHAADLSLSEAEAESEDDSTSSEAKKAPAPKKSSFVPALTMGGYISGSGSDIDDDMDTAPRKNRRGQRARQQIWEKKYGSKAKHLQQQDRKTGWDSKRGAVDRNVRGGQKPPRFAKAANAIELGPRRQKMGAGAAEGIKKKAVKKDDSGPLHPSWEAAKRAKEKKSAPVAFQGKKISFD